MSKFTESSASASAAKRKTGARKTEERMNSGWQNGRKWECVQKNIMDDEMQPARRYVKKRLLEIQECARQLQQSAELALKEISRLDEIRIRRWRCTHCGYVTAFSKPSTLEACGTCPKCKGLKFVPTGEAKPLTD